MSFLSPGPGVPDRRRGEAIVFSSKDICVIQLGPPVVPFYPFWGRVPLLKHTVSFLVGRVLLLKQTTPKVGTLFLSSLLEDLNNNQETSRRDS